MNFFWFFAHPPAPITFLMVRPLPKAKSEAPVNKIYYQLEST